MELVCRRCRGAVRVNAEQFDVFERMHYVCFHYEFEHGEFDVDEELACNMYEQLLERTAAAGLIQYEVANFGRSHRDHRGELPARACRHNVNYWRGGAWHGLGPSACGFVGGVRTRNWANTRLYCEQLERGGRAQARS